MDQKDLFVKSPQHLQKNVFVIYAPRSIKIEPETYSKIDTEVTVFLPQNSPGLLTSLFKSDEINGVFHRTPFVGRNIK